METLLRIILTVFNREVIINPISLYLMTLNILFIIYKDKNQINNNIVCIAATVFSAFLHVGIIFIICFFIVQYYIAEMSFLYLWLFFMFIIVIFYVLIFLLFPKYLFVGLIMTIIFLFISFISNSLFL